ncbi:hypothetical protein KC19_VG279600 [Ceratodon purpureus]|uniref:Uncharacterized protein n=1 Tax=Ceratodon purpureus TaxID=3225 RepID=A0A8T0HV30_CERPU|nr:hypothetical protein KC19_VG279600 [Ceratodon purpureus]
MPTAFAQVGVANCAPVLLVQRRAQATGKPLAAYVSRSQVSFLLSLLIADCTRFCLAWLLKALS